MKRLNLAAFGVFVAALVTSGFGCELLTAPDRTKIGTGGTGGETTTTSGGGGVGGETTSGGSGGTGGTTSSGGTGGTGGTPCTTPADCPDPGNECVAATCVDDQCGTEAKAEGTVSATQTAKDCKLFQCNGAGTLEAIPDDADLPVDDNECTDDVCTAGEPTNPPVAAGEACVTNGSLCDGAGKCVECIVADDCAGQDTECQTRTCDAGVCGVANAAQGAPVASQTAGDCKKDQCDGNGAVESVSDNLDVEDDGNDCTDNSCNAGTPVVVNTALDSACGAGGALKCDGAGACVGCTNAGQCGTPGNACLVAACNGGSCGTADKANGTACDDGNACTQTDTCQAGACTGASPVVCTAQDQCHDVGTCAPATGVCSNPTKANGAVCSDGNGCTQSDTCQAGTCTGANPVVCTAQDQCHDVGTCAPATGLCSNPNKANGVTCSDGNACTQTDTCQAGTCTGASPVVCTAQDQCHDVGTCAPATGVCSNPNKANGVTCSDGNACTQTDTCQTGTCTGANPVVCTAQDQCHDVGTCAPATGVCSNPNKMDGVTCSDGNGCTQTDTCQAGTCTGASPVVCTAVNDCHDVGTCAPATGMCSNPLKMDGVTCAGGVCMTGSCISNTCGDGMLNGSETAIDCGGGACPTCANTKACLAGTDCTSGNCVGNVCVECVTPASCPGGADTECHIKTCIANVCGINNPALGTVTATQTPKDCKENQCDGAGGIVIVNQDTDLPVDTTLCTTDVCTAGVASNPPASAGTVCSDNGGTACNGAGVCVAPPAVASTTPSDGAAAVASTSTVAVTFTKAMNPATLTAQTSGGACTGSIQVSRDNFATCGGFLAAAPTMTAGNTVATLTPGPGLSYATGYKIRVTVAATDAVGIPLAAAFTQPTGFATGNAVGCGTSVVISQIFGGGGNTGAPFKNDFIGLHNRGTAAVDVSTWSVQYASATGGTWQVTNLVGSIPAGGYYLVQEGAGAGNGATLPTADATGAISMSGTAGKVALVNTQTALTGTCPTGATIVDFAGFGSQVVATGCWEGTATTPAPSNTTSVLRAIQAQACTDSNNNVADFVAGTVNPRNTASPVQVCGCGINDSDVAAELDFCNVQFPTSISVATGAQTPTIFAQAYEAGVTDPAGAAANLVAQIGYGPTTSNPEYEAGWSWTSATFNTNVGNNDEWQAQLTAPAAGTYRYSARFSFDGLNWTYCDLNGAGSNAGLAFENSQLPTLTVTP